MAWTGSSLAARRAGSQQATSPTVARAAATAMKTTGRWVRRRWGAGHEARGGKGGGESEGEAGEDLPEAAAHDQQHDVAEAGAERDADADFLGAAAGGLREHRVDADGGHDQRDERESHKDFAEEVEIPLVVLDGAGENPGVAEGQILIEALDSRADGFGGIAGGLDDEGHAAPADLAEGLEEERIGILRVDVLNDVGGDADDGDPVAGLVGVVVEAEAAAEGGAAGPEALRRFRA